MKHLATTIALLAVLAGSAYSQARDTIDASAAWYTFRLDSTYHWTGSLIGTMEHDTSYQSDTRYRRDDAEYIEIWALSDGRPDTIVVKQLLFSGYLDAIDGSDSVWVTVPLVDLSLSPDSLMYAGVSRKTIDSLAIIDQGPYTSTQGNQYFAGHFAIGLTNPDARMWRIERVSGNGHPTTGDDGATHKLVFDIVRKRRR